jgi:hypothetical protein
MKNICLIQSDKACVPYDIPHGTDYLLLQWQPQFQPHAHSIHLPRCTWAEGRNELYRQARKRGDYDYFIFLADDVRCEFKLRDFEHLLAEHRPRRAAPYLLDHPWNYTTISRIDCVKYIDHAYMALRGDCAGELLPYTLAHDAACWSLGSEDLCERFWAKWPYGTLRFNELVCENALHREYPRNGNGPTRFDNRVRPYARCWQAVVLTWFAGRCRRKAQRLLKAVWQRWRAASRPAPPGDGMRGE